MFEDPAFTKNSEPDTLFMKLFNFLLKLTFTKAFTGSLVSCRRHNFLKRCKCGSQFSQNKDSTPNTHTLKGVFADIENQRLLKELMNKK